MRDNFVQLAALRQHKTSLVTMLDKLSSEMNQVDMEWLNFAATQAADTETPVDKTTTSVSFQSAEDINSKEVDISVPARTLYEDEEIEEESD